MFSISNMCAYSISNAYNSKKVIMYAFKSVCLVPLKVILTMQSKTELIYQSCVCRELEGGSSYPCSALYSRRRPQWERGIFI